MFDRNQGSMTATLGLPTNRNHLPLDSAISVKKLLPIFFGLLFFEEQQQLNEPIFDAFRFLDKNIFCAATVDYCHSKILKSIRVAVIPTNSRRDFIWIYEGDYMVTQVGGKITKGDLLVPFATGAG